MTRHSLDAPDMLTDGTWQPDGAILRWVSNSAPAPAVNVADLIACPTCRSKGGETCKSRGGNAVLPHTSRIVARYCPCGTPLRHRRGSRRKLCDDCRHEESCASKRRARARLAKCGTDSGYRRHRRLGEPACGSCLEAHAYEARRTYTTRKDAA